ncbi:hypothetical protein Patl1_12532 [Pistacia atlantica]|uniref:Uncharacterized protein n=1 Tax=Pistacia atlantica TaxID=434234 RepID=A0ACC1AUH9_9ROSI|nr:hypothetical protein Patl1_12532 [Pistacia atlantica]
MNNASLDWEKERIVVAAQALIVMHICSYHLLTKDVFIIGPEY